MVDVFRRVMLRIEPQRQFAPVWWLVLVGVIGIELFYFFGLFQFAPTVLPAMPWPLLVG